MAKHHGSFIVFHTATISAFALLVIALFGMAYDHLRSIAAPHAGISSKKVVAVTLEPFGEIARAIGGDDIEVVQLIVSLHDGVRGPGDDLHLDTDLLKRADLVLYGGPLIEPDVEKKIHGMTGVTANIVNVSTGARLLERVPSEQVVTGASSADPAFWLDADNATILVQNIQHAIASTDAQVERRSMEYQVALRAADLAARQAMSGCRLQTMIEGGGPHFAYLAKRYHLNYFAMPANDSSAMRAYAQIVRDQQIPYLFYDQSAGAQSANAIANITDAGTRSLDARIRFFSGESTVSAPHLSDLLMQNARTLAQGLECLHDSP